MESRITGTGAPFKRPSCVLFDLDGTILDSAPGIVDCLAETVRHFGGTPPVEEELRAFVGPPIAQTLAQLTPVRGQNVAAAVAHYRALYLDRGIANSTVFPGVFAMLGMLRELGLPLAVATSKRESHARLMLEHHRLGGIFVTVSGAGEDESGSEKRLVVADALRRLGSVGFDVSRPLLVGDRAQDVAGAASVGVPSVFASWGYGSAGEAEGALLSAASPLEVFRAIEGGGASGHRQAVASSAPAGVASPA